MFIFHLGFQFDLNSPKFLYINPVDMILILVSFARVDFNEKQMYTGLKFSVEKNEVCMEALHSNVLISL